MTRIAYIVSAYHLPGQLERLLRRLAAPDVRFAVHVDRKTRRAVYEEMVERTRDLEVAFLPRHVSHWGGFGHVRATLKGIDHLVRERVPFDYAVLLTGQDYPLRSPHAIAAVLGGASGRSFMNHWALPYPPWGDRGGLDRIQDWHLITYRRLHLAVPLRRRLPLGLTPYGGGAYWCLSRPVVDHVHGFVHANPGYVRFFEHVLIPDELFFQTIVMNSPLRDSVENDNLRYLDWSREPGPAVLVRDDVPALVASHKLFARKFDERIDASPLDLLDAHIDGEGSRSVD
ncbi:MAG: beta-1,6-N-acetylglucosaminyltransferase [Gaiellaceae bacterium]